MNPGRDKRDRFAFLMVGTVVVEDFVEPDIRLDLDSGTEGGDKEVPGTKFGEYGQVE